MPDGCYGLDMGDGAKYDAKPGGVVDVEPAHARAIRRGWYGQSGVMRGGPQFSFGTKTGRRCRPCKRTWNSWSLFCPKCGKATQPE
jgi:hypothetical protein